MVVVPSGRGTSTRPSGVMATPSRTDAATMREPQEAGDERVGGRRQTLVGVPCWTIRPASITTTRSASANASLLVVGDGERRSCRAPGRGRGARSSSRSRRRAVERSQRLVEHQQPRARRERAGQRHPLLLAARERGHRPSLGARQAHQVQQLAQPAPRLGGRAPRIRSPKATLAPTSRCGNSAWSWNISPTPRRCGGARRGRRRPRAPAPLGRFEPGDHPQQRGLAAAARAEHADDLAGSAAQVDRVERGRAAPNRRSRPRAEPGSGHQPSLAEAEALEGRA